MAIAALQASAAADEEKRQRKRLVLWRGAR
jgi:hypothetical protein